MVLLSGSLTAAVVGAADAMGTAGLVLQIDDIRARIGIDEGDPATLVAFSLCLSALYALQLGALFTHGILFSCLGPRGRSVVAYATMALTHLVAIVVWYSASEPLSRSLVWVFVVFGLCGFSTGTSSPNVVTFVSSFGDETMRWWSFGANLGWSLVGVGYFASRSAFGGSASSWLPLTLHVIILVANCVALFSLASLRPPEGTTFESEGVHSFVGNVKAWRSWLPLIRFEVAAFGFVGWASVFVHGFVQLVYHPHEQRLLPGVVVSPNTFMALYCLSEFVGGTVGAFPASALSQFGRPLGFPPLVATVGVVMVMSKVPLLGVLSSSFVFLGVSTLMAAGPMRMRAVLPQRYHASANTAWYISSTICRIASFSAAGPWASILGESTM